MSDFVDADLAGARFERANLRGARFDMTHLDGATFRNVALEDVTMRDVDMINVTITGYIENVSINGVEVADLVAAELDRREPLRVKMRPTDAAGFREAWDIIERLWGDTVRRARALDPTLLNESVDGEWSFIETLRHLTFATDAWVRRGILGEETPWHPLGLPWDQAPNDLGRIPRDRAVRPTLDEALDARLDRMRTVRRYVDRLTDELLASDGPELAADGWPRPGRSYSVRDCLSVVLNEEWEHRRFAERDLDALEPTDEAD